MTAFLTAVVFGVSVTAFLVTRFSAVVVGRRVAPVVGVLLAAGVLAATTGVAS